MSRARPLTVALALLAASPAGAAPAAPGAAWLSPSGPLRLDLPLVDLPYDRGAGGPRGPSMAQALAVGKGATQALAWGVTVGVERACEGAWCGSERARWSLVLPANVVLVTLAGWLPGFYGWTHEEFHRAVMGQYGIASFDEMNGAPLGASTVSVSHERDADLAWLKRHHNPDMVRLSAAGMEGDVELVRAIDAEGFFDRRDFRRDLVTALLTRVNVAGYMMICDSATGTAETRRLEDEEGTNVAKRDFTGLDCSGWAYDLQRPDEPYEARGTHPSGVGIRRYRTTDDLTPTQRRLLTRAKWLSLTNFASPAMLGIDWQVPFAPAAWRMSGGLAHQLTSFGEALTLDLYVRGNGERRWRIAARAYEAQALWLPGLEVEHVRLPFSVGGQRFEATPAVAVWLQPRHGRWDGGSGEAGGLARLRVAWAPSPRFGTFVEVQGKSQGWVGGTVALAPAVDVRAGVGGTL